MRKTYFTLALSFAVLTSVTAAAAATTVSIGSTQNPAVMACVFTYRGPVTHVVDGDTLDVRLTSGRTSGSV